MPGSKLRLVSTSLKHYNLILVVMKITWKESWPNISKINCINNLNHAILGFPAAFHIALSWTGSNS